MGFSSDYPRLCGGTFFTLLTRAMKKHGRSRNGYSGSLTGITEANLLKDLIRVFYPSYPDLALSTEKTNAVRYKQGKNLGFGFDDNLILNKFDRTVKFEYKKALLPMNELVKKYIDAESYGIWLIKALLQLIFSDEHIPGDAYFFINFTEVKKSNLEYIDKYLLPGFLLGVWHYILMQVRDNTVGFETYCRWYPDSKRNHSGSKHKFVSNIGTDDKKAIIVINEVEIQKSELKPTEKIKNEIELSVEYKDYLSSARKKYTNIKTILHDELKPFRSFYVCNGLTRCRFLNKHPIKPDGKWYIDVPTVDSLEEESNFIVIIGTGGLGKSMMMQHIMLDTIDRCDELGRIPIFIYLKDYNDSNYDISEFVFEQFKGRYPQLTREKYDRDLINGRYVLLFDGMDEINSIYRGQFETKFDLFADANSNNMMIISSRPFSDFLNLRRFTLMNLRPFTKDKALELIDKLEFREDEPEIKRKFHDDLDRYLFYTHREFAENPLLLTFMLMTYERFGPVATKRHAFYSEVYDLLAKRHDATKVGYSRKMKTGLSPERLKEIFAAFCANTYQRQIYSFTRNELEDEFRKILCLSKNESEHILPPSSFVDDFTNAICLMYKDGEKYFFMHRSFQEYFCALSFSKQLDENLQAIGAFFENNGGKKKYLNRYDILRLNGDQTFDMLYDMIPDRVEKFILFPYLIKLFKACDSNEGYWSFLQKVRPWFVYENGIVDSSNITNITISSFLYGFIVSRYKIRHDIDEYPEELPYYDGFVEDRFVEIKREDGKTVVVNEESTAASKIEDPEYVGWTLSVKVNDLLSNKEQYQELIEIMERPDFPFMKEFLEARKLMERLSVSTNIKTPNLITIV